MVEVFKTNVQAPAQASVLSELLLQHFPDSVISFDLADCDKVLRMEGNNLDTGKVEGLVKQRGFCCQVLE